MYTKSINQKWREACKKSMSLLYESADRESRVKESRDNRVIQF